jgi:hypothetical protein
MTVYVERVEWTQRTPAIAIACLLVGAAGVAVRANSQAPAGAGGAVRQADLRLHHLHFRSTDPAAAMSEAARAIGGVRVVVQGLGVGVRVGEQYLLFDRLTDGLDAPENAGSSSAAFEASTRWLARRGLSTEPASFSAAPVSAARVTDRLDHVAFATDDLERIARALAVKGTPPTRRTDDSLFYETDEGGGVEITRETERPDAFWCPMHPDLRSPAAGTCPVCSMDLVAIPPPRLGDYRLEVTTEPDDGVGLRSLRLGIRDPGTGAPVDAFTEVHERLLHLFIVSRDLSFFAHEHPERTKDGFELRRALGPGVYMLIADFMPSAGTPQMVQRTIVTPGYAGSPFAAGPELDLDMSDKTVDGVRVRLGAGPIRAARESVLRFSVSDAASGRPLTDLEPYLGAPGHLLLVNGDLTRALHAHPTAAITSGPDVAFDVLVPAPGFYKLWLQIQRKGKVITAPFVIDVE